MYCTFDQKWSWATFWAMLHETQLVTLDKAHILMSQLREFEINQKMSQLTVMEL
jgi:hypothetical protein